MKNNAVSTLGPRDAVIVAYGRSPLARANKGSFVNTHPVEYGAQTLRGVLNRLNGLDETKIDDVIVGCAMPERYCGHNIARLITLRAGLPNCVSAQTVNRFCSSGLQTIATAANAIMANQADIIVAGGVEKMTDLQMDLPKEYQDSVLQEEIPGLYMPMGITAENVANEYNISRMQMDQMAVDSHKKADAAQKAHKFDDEIIPISVNCENGETKIVDRDEGIRPGTTLDTLAGLKPCFKQDGAVTAATSSQMTDGAAFVVIMAREVADQYGFKPIAKFIGFAVGGVRPEVMGVGPMVAVPKVMKRTGLTVDDMDVIEINEAFAAQALPCISTLKFPVDKVNPNGGALALGHPLGATGAVLVCKALSELKRTKGQHALITMCIGGGMGAAGIFKME